MSARAKRKAPRLRIVTAMGIRISFPVEPGRFARILKTVSKHGGDIQAHLYETNGDQGLAFILCEEPAAAALALTRDGSLVETETVVTITLPPRPRTLRHLVETLEAHGSLIGQTFATTARGAVLLVFRTNDNPRAEDLLRGYLDPVAHPSEFKPVRVGLPKPISRPSAPRRPRSARRASRRRRRAP